MNIVDPILLLHIVSKKFASAPPRTQPKGMARYD